MRCFCYCSYSSVEKEIRVPCANSKGSGIVLKSSETLTSYMFNNWFKFQLLHLFCLRLSVPCKYLNQTVKGLQSKGLMPVPIFLDWPHLIFLGISPCLCTHINYYLQKKRRDTCTVLHAPVKRFSALLENLILLPWRTKSLVWGHSSQKLEKGWNYLYKHMYTYIYWRVGMIYIDIFIFAQCPKAKKKSKNRAL